MQEVSTSSSMVDHQSNADSKTAVLEEPAIRECQTSSTTWSEVPFLILIIPVGLFFGWHLAGLAMLIRKYLRIPYIVTLVSLYAALAIPLWIWYDEHPTVLGIGTALVLLASTVPILIVGRDEVMNGTNLEHSAAAHMMLIVFYLAMPAFDSIAKTNLETHEKQNSKRVDPPIVQSGLTSRLDRTSMRRLFVQPIELKRLRPALTRAKCDCNFNPTEA